MGTGTEHRAALDTTALIWGVMLGVQNTLSSKLCL